MDATNVPEPVPTSSQVVVALRFYRDLTIEDIAALPSPAWDPGPGGGLSGRQGCTGGRGQANETGQMALTEWAKRRTLTRR